MKKICQSCGSQMVKGQLDRRGTNADGTRSDVYCNYCYLNGKFQNPNLTYDQMLEDGLRSIEISNAGKFNKWMTKKLYPKLLLSLSRWR